MEITIQIDGRDVRFKKSGGTMRRYKSMFGREWFADLDRIARMQKKASEQLKKAKLDAPKTAKGKKKAADGELTDDQVYSISAIVAECYESDPFYDMLYTMAREADPAVPDTVDAWLDSFEDFSFLEVWAAVSPMLSREMKVDPKNA